MAHKNGTYIAFHAEGTNVPINTDMKYYHLIEAWTEKEADDFYMVNSHDKTYAVRDSSKRTTLENRLKERLRHSKHMLLIVGSSTKNDKDWIPYEIRYAVDICNLPLIICYTGYKYILTPSKLSNLWPKALSYRIEKQLVKAIHIPFKKEPIKFAIENYDLKNKPKGSLTYFTKTTYKKLGIDTDSIL